MALAEEAAALAGLPLVCSKNLERDLAVALAMIYLTQSEGLGSGILLAMAYGVTVVASRTGGIPEVIEDGVNGILVENEAKSIVDGLNRIRGVCAKLGSRPRNSPKPLHRIAHAERHPRFLPKGSE